MLRSASTTTLTTIQRVDRAERESAFVADYELPAFVKLCSKVCAMYGIALPEAQLLQMLHEFIGKHFRWVTFEHFNLAFELNAANELEKKCEHYGALSVSFIGDVLTAYKPHRDKANLQIQREIAEAKEEESKQLKEKEMAVNDDSWRRMLAEDIASYKKAIAQVGAEAGVTTKLKILRLDERVRLIDSPGLDDVRAENSQITREFLKHIDVGILVVTGAADASQKRYLDDLRSHCESSVFVALNKIDEWDDLEPSALEDIVNQWKQVLQAEKIYPVCSKEETQYGQYRAE